MKKHTKENRSSKLAIVVLMLMLSFTGNAQKAENFNGEEAKQILQSATMQVVLTGNKELDEKIKFGFNTYWKLSKFTFITQEKFNGMSPGKDYSTFFRCANFASESFGGFTFTKVDVSVVLKNLEMYRMIEIQFDDMVSKKNNKDLGIDNHASFILSKIVPYIMLMNTQLKKQIEVGNREYARYNGNKSELSKKTVLVQKEYFTEDIDSALVKQLTFKTLILPTENIKSIIDAKKDLGNYAQLYFASTHRFTVAFIVDLQTGDLLNYAELGMGEPQIKAMSGKTYKKLIKALSKE